MFLRTALLTPSLLSRWSELPFEKIAVAPASPYHLTAPLTNPTHEENTARLPFCVLSNLKWVQPNSSALQRSMKHVMLSGALQSLLWIAQEDVDRLGLGVAHDEFKVHGSPDSLSLTFYNQEQLKA